MLGSSSTSSIVNGLSDHDAQFITINNIAPANNTLLLSHTAKQINNEAIIEFQLSLKNETWK